MSDNHRLRLLQLLTDIRTQVAESRSLVAMASDDEVVQRRTAAELVEIQNALQRIEHLLNPRS